MVSRLRDALYRAITTTRGDSLAVIRLPKELARDLNMTLGMPLASRDELAKRTRAGERLNELRAAGTPGSRASAAAAPVFVYFEKDRNVRELARIEELLGAKAIAWTRLDITGDEATLAFVTVKAKCEADDLPVVFVADAPVGTYEALVRADVSGELARLVHPS
jgi:hypothetical protein